MKKVLNTLICLAMMMAGMGLKAQEITITLSQGWNWISYPNAVSMEIGEALGSYVPMEGDIIKSQLGFVEYSNGQWIGGFTHFMPGKGYVYYSSRSETISFVFAQAASSAVATATPTDITAVSAVVGGMVMLPESSHVFLRGICWGTMPNPDIDGNHTTEGTGIGSFTTTLDDLNPNTTYYVRAYAVTDFGLAYGEGFSFSTLSEGFINGLFSINAIGNQVYFSQGNLQYQASTNTWRFAENQWDCLRLENENISSSYDGWIDLFGWGTSGYNHGAVCYQPWSTSTSYADYYVYGNMNYNLYDQTGQADWGYNAISNGGNTENQWRTLTSDEWSYLLFSRDTPSGIRFAKAIVNDIEGLVVLPDNWDPSFYDLNETNNTSANYSVNVINENDWMNVLETHGTVFLPAGSYRRGSSSIEQSNPYKAYYWTSSKVKYFEFNNTQLFVGDRPRDNGLSVRLARSVEIGSIPTVTTAEVTDITETTAVCGGIVTDDGGDLVTERGVCWSTSPSPTLSNNHTNDGIGTGSFVSTLTSLTPNTTYYVRAYACNSHGTVYGDQQSFTTEPLPSNTYIVTVASSPMEAGMVTGGGTYQQGQSCTVTATANSGYVFSNWTVNGSVVSSDAIYTFTVTEEQSLVANFEGHGYVDLGLPSGTLWATCNVGAETSEGYGYYFAWGETQSKGTYSWYYYQYCHQSSNSLTRYCNDPNYGYQGYTDNLTTLLSMDDAAMVNWSSDWRMPTYLEWQELYQYTTQIWTKRNGVKGRLFIAANGNSLFLPAAGYRNGGSLVGVGNHGCYWSNLLNTTYPTDAWAIYFTSSNILMKEYYRYYGRPVRAVRSAR